jgi:hypothetical protein
VRPIGIAYGSAEAKEAAEREAVVPVAHPVINHGEWREEREPDARDTAAAQTLGLLAGMAGAFGFGFGFGSDLPPLRLSPPIRNHTSTEALARAEEKRARKAAARRGKA